MSGRIIGWAVFLLTSVLGHVALKRGVQETAGRSVLAVTGSSWTWLAVLSWSIATLLWLWILRFEPLMKANSVSTLRYVLLGVASWTLLQEPLTVSRATGMILIAIGVYLAAR